VRCDKLGGALGIGGKPSPQRSVDEIRARGPRQTLTGSSDELIDARA